MRIRLDALASGLVVLSLSLIGCGHGEPDLVAGYVYLGEDRTVASIDPILRCREWAKCSPAGYMAGVMAATTARDADLGGWGLEIEFLRSWSDEELAPVRAELERRAEELGLGPVEFIGADDEWPSCRGEPDCLTVDESILP